MTSPTLGRWATDYTAEALRRAALIDESFGDFRLHETALTPRETLAHLVECTVAYDQISRGEKPDWAPYEAHWRLNPSGRSSGIDGPTSRLKAKSDASFISSLSPSMSGITSVSSA